MSIYHFPLEPCTYIFVCRRCQHLPSCHSSSAVLKERASVNMAVGCEIWGAEQNSQWELPSGDSWKKEEAFLFVWKGGHCFVSTSRLGRWPFLLDRTLLQHLLLPSPPWHDPKALWELLAGSWDRNSIPYLAGPLEWGACRLPRHTLLAHPAPSVFWAPLRGKGLERG